MFCINIKLMLKASVFQMLTKKNEKPYNSSEKVDKIVGKTSIVCILYIYIIYCVTNAVAVMKEYPDGRKAKCLFSKQNKR